MKPFLCLLTIALQILESEGVFVSLYRLLIAFYLLLCYCKFPSKLVTSHDLFKQNTMVSRDISVTEDFKSLSVSVSANIG